jgi:hypothetical protein
MLLKPTCFGRGWPSRRRISAQRFTSQEPGSDAGLTHEAGRQQSTAHRVSRKPHSQRVTSVDTTIILVILFLWGVVDWTFRVRSLAWQDFSRVCSVQTDSGTQPASYQMRTGDNPRGYSGRGLKLTTHLHLVPRSRMVELMSSWHSA